MQNLSGGELQRVALTLCLGKPADVYLIDEPSAYLDSEQRLMAARVIKRSEVTSHLPPVPPSLHRTLPHSVRVRPQVHPPRQEDGVRGGARLHHGDLPGRQSHRVRRSSLQEDRGQHVRRAHGAFILLFFKHFLESELNLLLQASESVGGDEPLPVAAGDHVQTRPQQLQATNQQAQLHQGDLIKSNHSFFMKY